MYEHEKHLVGVYETEQEAIKAVEDLKRQGYATEDISVIGANNDTVNEINDATGTKTEDDLLAGAATGGAIGGLVGLLAGVGALAIPGIGPFVAAGPIAATLSGAALGAGVGGLAGALVGMGFEEDDADRYEGYVKEGKILVLVDRRETRVGDEHFDTLEDDRLSGRTMNTNEPTNAVLTSGNPNDPRLR
ncbi:putative membrane protein [Bacillus sp. SORGH_AS 510]|uniref:general stress protein n=1 Tax=Bacillus sp. SORGH_AS_0510 TaxID=3041771 RepID=UPI0027879E04|nr:general stress protein [Bacillus sp. SORGH_AS_0510]MDQ1146150.1 putative membrane protein [Bacillus sp. SORGH_AS_0510]